MLINLKEKIRQVVYSIILPPRLPQSYSQAGEDAILRFLFADKKIDKISYLDLGTNLPDHFNNTYLFYKNGSRGICVEADKSLIPKIKKIRPEDKTLNVGVSIEGEKESNFYIFDVKGLSTFDKEEAERRKALGTLRLTEVVKVKLLDINTIIKNNFDTYPDFLSIDIEGLDLPVLKTLDFEKYPIPVICAETCIYNDHHIKPKDKSIIEFMLTKGYEIYADTYINTIFVNKEWFYAS